MPAADNHRLSFDEWDEQDNPIQDIQFDTVLSRRYFLLGTFALGSLYSFPGTSGMNSPGIPSPMRNKITFEPVQANSLDTVTVPPGFKWHTVVRWGDPLFDHVPEFDQITRGQPSSQALSFGDNNDGMDIFRIDGKNVLVVNNEYVNLGLMFGNNPSGLPKTPEDIHKCKMAHGVTIMEIVENKGRWEISRDSPFNRRITPETPCMITGPARGSDLLKTKHDPDGTTVLGTFNNCGNGRTPWGTYLACEENFNGYFSSSAGEDMPRTDEMTRYGIRNKDWGYGWANVDERFDLASHPNEPNRHGYVTEINPANGSCRKLTALGRIKHENAEVAMAGDGRVVVYMGDDERGEYLYKFVSAKTHDPSGMNEDLLHDGELYVARFSPDGSGKWINLLQAGLGREYTLVFTRIAASRVDATTMDRPEWVAVNPNKVEIYCCLTNNAGRGKNASQPLNPVNPRTGNIYGHIVRLTPTREEHGSADFTWDMYVMAGNPAGHRGIHAGSPNINEENMFNSPDGLKFDSSGNLWIQTDGPDTNEGDYEGMGNNQMLMGNPVTGEIKRFLVGPRDCEVTGLTWSPDKKTMFVGIQHPGVRGNSHWPDGGDAVPRSSIIAIRKDDGSIIG